MVLIYIYIVFYNRRLKFNKSAYTNVEVYYIRSYAQNKPSLYKYVHEFAIFKDIYTYNSKPNQTKTIYMVLKI